jgi:6-phosphofructokinase 1
MSHSKNNCLIGQSGGPTVAINSSLSGIIHSATKSGKFHTIYGMLNGIEGLLEKKLMNLSNLFDTDEKLHRLKQSPAMYLGSCRFKLPTHIDSPETYNKIFEIFKEFEISSFFYIGGNDSMDTVLKLSTYAKQINYDINIIGVPKTIDNDLMSTDHTPGFGSAAKFVATSILEVTHDSMIYPNNSVTIVEIMGRNAGWLTAASVVSRTAYSNAPDLIYLPERTFDLENFIEDIENSLKCKKHIVIAVSEGIKNKEGVYISASSNTSVDAFGHVILNGTGKALEALVKQRIGCKVRSIELNVLQRCSMHIASKTDLDEAFEIGSAAVNAALSGQTGKMMVFVRREGVAYKSDITSIDIKDAANLEKAVPLEWINKRGNGVTEEVYNYVKPLIQGEVIIDYINGIPNYMDISHL